MKILITGGTNGMGKGLGKVLASMDDKAHEIIILCRSQELGEATIKEFEKDTMNHKISIVLCDLAKLRDVKLAIKEIQSKHTYLDGVFINAGLGYAAARVETEDGMDSHFQVNYLSQFMLTLNLLNLLEQSEQGGRIIFNVTEGGEIFWEDMQMRNKWGYEKGITQAMVAKRMFLMKLHQSYLEKKKSKVSFVGFQIAETVWTNQINIIPAFMRIMATVMKWFGTFITMEKSGEIMAPLFTEKQEDTYKRSGKLVTWKKGSFEDVKDDATVMNQALQDRLWAMSLALCDDEETTHIAEALINNL